VFVDALSGKALRAFGLASEARRIWIRRQKKADLVNAGSSQTDNGSSCLFRLWWQQQPSNLRGSFVLDKRQTNHNKDDPVICMENDKTTDSLSLFEQLR